MPKQKSVEQLKRPPIVTIMGHVDHGKTSLLDAIRQSHITESESGGITQHIGAYTVEQDGGRITFIDTPGHEAFTQMRERGGQAADIVVLVVAADDGVMPQTKEAIKHAQSANVPIVVAINKCDLESASPEKVKRQLSQEGVQTEGYGGDVVAVEVSAKKKTGLDKLLEVISLVSELNDERLKIDPAKGFEALVIESRHDPKRGISVSVIVKNGELNIRDEIFTSKVNGRVRSMIDSTGKSAKVAKPGDAIEILGFSELPDVGAIVTKEQVSKKAEGTEKEVVTWVADTDVESKNLKLLIRADTVGTQEAIVQSLKKIKVEEAVPEVLFAGTGDVKESDVLLASTARAIIMAFKVGVPATLREFALGKKVIIRGHDVIYKLLEEVEAALEGVLEIEESKIKGRGLVIKIFTLPKSNMKVAGTLVEAGSFKPGNRVGIFRDDPDVPLKVSKIKSVHVGHSEVNSVKKGDECGLLLKPQFDEVQLDDRVEVL